MTTFPYLGSEIRRRREEQHMPREHVARLARVSTSHIKRAEKQQTQRMDEKAIEGIAFALQCHPIDIAPEYVGPNLPYLPRVRYNPQMMKERRAEMGLRLQDVGEMAGLSLECIAKMEHKNSANRDSVRKVARALQLPLHEFAPLYRKLYPTPDERAIFPPAEFSRPEDDLE